MSARVAGVAAARRAPGRLACVQRRPAAPARRNSCSAPRPQRHHHRAARCRCSALRKRRGWACSSPSPGPTPGRATCGARRSRSWVRCWGLRSWALCWMDGWMDGWVDGASIIPMATHHHHSRNRCRRRHPCRRRLQRGAAPHGVGQGGAPGALQGQHRDAAHGHGACGGAGGAEERLAGAVWQGCWGCWLVPLGCCRGHAPRLRSCTPGCRRCRCCARPARRARPACLPAPARRSRCRWTGCPSASSCRPSWQRR